MKLMIASDLHGSAHYVKKFLDRYRAEAPDRLLLLGDLLYHGPRNPLPQDYDCPAVADALNAVRDRLLTVRGNCDCEVDQMLLHFPILADYALLLAGVWYFRMSRRATLWGAAFLAANCLTAAFNLLPIPPLDGAQILHAAVQLRRQRRKR